MVCVSRISFPSPFSFLFWLLACFSFLCDGPLRTPGGRSVTSRRVSASSRSRTLHSFLDGNSDISGEVAYLDPTRIVQALRTIERVSRGLRLSYRRSRRRFHFPLPFLLCFFLSALSDSKENIYISISCVGEIGHFPYTKLAQALCCPESAPLFFLGQRH